MKSTPTPVTSQRIHCLTWPAAVAEAVHAHLGSAEGGARERVACFDTDQAHLARWGIGLERRGTDRAWWLDLPVLGKATPREQVRVGTGSRVPAALTRWLAPLLGGAPLVRLARLRVTGRPAGEGLVYEHAVLEGSPAGAGCEHLAVAEDTPWAPLAALGAVPRAGTRLEALFGPPVAIAPLWPPDPPAEGASAAAILGSHLARHTQALGIQAVRLWADLPDAVHQVRVAARRLRSTLRVFRDLLPPEADLALRGELAWLAGEMGAYRDAEVRRARLTAQLAGLPAEVAGDAQPLVIQPLFAHLEAGRQQALAALATPRFPALVAQLVAAAADPPVLPVAAEPAAEILPPALERAWRRLRRAVRLITPEAPAERWHEARIRAKQARYAAEALVPVLGREARRRARLLARLTELLGTVQDAEVAFDALVELARSASARGAVAVGVLAGLELSHQRAAQAEFPAAWAEVQATWRR